MDLSSKTRNTLNVGRAWVIVIILLGLIGASTLKPLNTSAIFVPKEVDAYELIVDGKTWFVLENVSQISKA